jgi:nitrate reductase NapE component
VRPSRHSAKTDAAIPQQSGIFPTEHTNEITAFIFADLIVIPILNISYRKYYGLKMAGFLFVTFYVAMAGAALIAGNTSPRPLILLVSFYGRAAWTS